MLEHTHDGILNGVRVTFEPSNQDGEDITHYDFQDGDKLTFLHSI